MLHAVHNGATGCVRELVAGRVDITIPDRDGESALGMACRKGALSEASHLLAHPDASRVINLSDRQGATPLSWACQNGFGEIVASLLRAGVDKELPNGKGGTPLMLAVTNGNQSCVEQLIEAGVDLHKVDGDGDSPLVCAVIKENIPAAELLIKGRADVSATNYMGLAPIDIAVAKGVPKAVRLLLEQGASPELSPLQRRIQAESGPAADECHRLLRDAERIRAEAEQRRLVEQEAEERSNQQQEVVQWLITKCSLSERDATRVMSALGAEGFGFDSVTKVEDLVKMNDSALWPRLDAAHIVSIKKAVLAVGSSAAAEPPAGEAAARAAEERAARTLSLHG